VAAGLAFAGPARAGTPTPPPIQIGISSQQAGPSRATVRAHVAARRVEPGRDGRAATSSVVRVRLRLKVSDNRLPNPYPPLSVQSPLARNPRPFGPGSFWYPVGPSRVCMYAPDSVLPCFTLVGSGNAPGAPGLNPQAIAASVADRLGLSPGRIHASPQQAGLTGATSWFWLEPAPRTEELTVSLVGETVAVSAEPVTVEWRFGDGASLAGGPGRPYESGPPPADAVVRVYQTRCLPGDQGQNPYVLPSCSSTGYPVDAIIVWRITFSARGPIDSTGTLPTRTTATSIAYPVSEARGFLTAGDSQ
jgi:hypothetical protein